MKFAKTVLISSVMAACSLAASSAFAASFTVGGGSSGTSSLKGNTSASVAGFPAVPCISTFNVQAPGASAPGQVSSASFAPPAGSTSTACNAITACNLPWPLTPQGAINTANNVKVNACVKIPALGGVTCTGTINGRLNKSGSVNNFTFNAALGVCTVKTTDATGLTNGSNPVIDIIWP